MFHSGVYKKKKLTFVGFLGELKMCFLVLEVVVYRPIQMMSN